MTRVAHRLIRDEPAGGAWNMAVDQALLAEAADGGPATLRFYRWSEPTLSLGYFQSYADREQHPASRNAAVVRRQSGGGAILHDRELTYSLVLPPAHPLASSAQALYDTVHQALVAILSQRLFGRSGEANLSLYQRNAFQEKRQEKRTEPFLCFLRRSEGDILMSEGEQTHKVVGSAQRRWRGAVLQHGSILLGRSPAAPELPGIGDLSHTSEELLRDTILQTLPVALSDEWDASIEESSLRPAERRRAEALLAERYGSDDWTRRR